MKKWKLMICEKRQIWYNITSMVYTGWNQNWIYLYISSKWGDGRESQYPKGREWEREDERMRDWKKKVNGKSKLNYGNSNEIKYS